MQHDGSAKASEGELHVLESDIKDLKILAKSDIFFAVVYGVLFLWGLALTLLAI